MTIEIYKFPKWMGPIPRVCAPWTNAEEYVLKFGFHRGDTLEMLCERHGRAAGGINSRLMRLIGESFEARNLSEQNNEFERTRAKDELYAIRDQVRTALQNVDKALERMKTWTPKP